MGKSETDLIVPPPSFPLLFSPFLFHFLSSPLPSPLSSFPFSLLSLISFLSFLSFSFPFYPLSPSPCIANSVKFNHVYTFSNFPHSQEEAATDPPHQEILLCYCLTTTQVSVSNPWATADLFSTTAIISFQEHNVNGTRQSASLGDGPCSLCAMPWWLIKVLPRINSSSRFHF